MVTPFTAENEIDYNAVEALVQWYLDQGVDGIFAVCQSSEMFALSLQERVELSSFVIDRVHGRVPVVVSGHTGNSMVEQVQELTAMAQTKPDALVLLTNRLAAQDEDDDCWLRRVRALAQQLPPSIPLGLYECPYPANRLLSAQTVKELAKDGRFIFYKETSCNLMQLTEKIQAADGSPLAIFNANSALYLPSLRQGAAGFCGVMGNMHPALYKCLDALHRASSPDTADSLQALSDFLAVTSCIESRTYPVSAKYYLQLEGLPVGLHTRTRDQQSFGDAQRVEVEGLRRMSLEMERKYRLLAGLSPRAGI